MKRLYHKFIVKFNVKTTLMCTRVTPVSSDCNVITFVFKEFIQSCSIFFMLEELEPSPNLASNIKQI